MTATVASYGTGRYQASEDDWYCHPKMGATKTGRAVLFCHGSGGNADDAVTPSLAGTFPLCQAISKRFPIVSGDLGGTTTWGNATSVTRTETLRGYAGTALGATNAKVHLIGISMGALTCFQMAVTNPTKVQSIAIIIGTVDLDYIYQNNIGSARAAIGTAWGVTFPTALPAAATILDDTSSWDGIPVKAWYVTDDTFTPTASLTGFIDSISTGSRVSLGAVGHTEAAIAAVPTADVVSFLVANNA